MSEAREGMPVPKENIQLGGDATIVVGWAKGIDVQLATLSGDDGWWLTVPRAAINRTIRVLQRARDAAYGEDA